MDSFVRARYKVNRTPAFQMLSEAQCREIYTAAVEILERTGAKVYDQESEILQKQAAGLMERRFVSRPD